MRLAQFAMADELGLTVGELRANMTLPEFICWQAYKRYERRERNKPAPPAELPELGALGPAGIAAALR